MKKFKKIFVALILALTVAALPVTALAAETDGGCEAGETTATETADATEDGSTDVVEDGSTVVVEEGTASGYTDTSDVTDSGYTSNADATKDEAESGYTSTADATKDEAESGYTDTSDATENATENSTAENGFEAIYDLCMEHLSEILSLAAFIGSLICALLYKSGVMPLLQKGLSALGNTALKIKESTELGEDKRKADYDSLKGKFDGFEEKLAALAESLTDYSDRLEAKESAELREKRMEALLLGEVEMLYDIFMTSALPEYEKVRVGERVAKMKEVISTYEGK